MPQMISILVAHYLNDEQANLHFVSHSQSSRWTAATFFFVWWVLSDNLLSSSTALTIISPHPWWVHSSPIQGPISHLLKPIGNKINGNGAHSKIAVLANRPHDFSFSESSLGDAQWWVMNRIVINHARERRKTRSNTKQKQLGSSQEVTFVYLWPNEKYF